jgi:hypothetical protein
MDRVLLNGDDRAWATNIERQVMGRWCSEIDSSYSPLEEKEDAAKSCRKCTTNYSDYESTA